MSQTKGDNPTIVVVAYNRPKSLKRILKSLANAYYKSNEIRLIISIDHGNNQEVLIAAEDFCWDYGEKIIIYQSKNLGLRNHILKCGDLTKVYGNIVLLEDDLYASKNFYEFSKEAIKFYINNEKIAGISLYSHQFNETAKLPFMPIQNEYDVYFMQLPSSWGQIWTENQWGRFRNWYNNKIEKSITNIKKIQLPNNIIGWPETSWKKYYSEYMIENDLFFVYPYLSLTTNFGDIGQHFWTRNTSFQTVLCNYKKNNYLFCEVEKTIAKYDAFCENLNLFKYIQIVNYKITRSNTTIDLYGLKNDLRKRYLLTSKLYNYKVIKKFDLGLKPIEENIINNIEGENIFLYDTQVKNKTKFQNNNLDILTFFYPGLEVKKAFKLIINIDTIKYIVKGIFIKILKKLSRKF
jgi:hypothetical protein